MILFCESWTFGSRHFVVLILAQISSMLNMLAGDIGEHFVFDDIPR